MKRLSLLLLFPATLFAQSQPINVPIQNPSFEQDVPIAPDNCGPWIMKAPAGWTAARLQAGGGYGVFQPANPNPCDVSLPPDGVKVAFLFHASISQDLGNVSGDGYFTLTFSVANRFYWYPAAYFATLKVVGPNGTLECSVSGMASGDFFQVPLVCLTQRRPGDLTITFTANGEFQSLFDKVSLSFTPSN